MDVVGWGFVWSSTAVLVSECAWYLQKAENGAGEVWQAGSQFAPGLAGEAQLGGVSCPVLPAGWPNDAARQSSETRILFLPDDT